MGTRFRLLIPIEKVDEERRTCSGWATTESIDKQSEIVDYGASKSAFDEWGGNIREMHEPKAVGRAVEVKADDKTRKIYVTAKISKGAEDTWEKVKDGTLTGFSIGGQTLDKTSQILKDTKTGTTRQITRITKYKLNELSLVDNPANPDAQFELVKSDSQGRLIQTEILVSGHSDTVQKSNREEDSTNEMAIMNREVLGKLSTLLSEIGEIVKQGGSWEDPNSEVSGAKKSPRQTTEGKEVTAKSDGSWEDPNPEVSGSKKSPRQTTEGKEVTAKADMTHPDQGVETQEDEEHGAAPVTKRRMRYYKAEDGKYYDKEGQPKQMNKEYDEDEDEDDTEKAEHPYEDEDEDDTEKADMTHPDQGVETQEDEKHGAAPVTKQEDEEDEDEDTTEKAEDEDEDEDDMPYKKRYTRKAHEEGHEDEEDTEKAEDYDDEDEESDTEKLDRILEVVTTLRKRVTTLEKSPMPRKYRKIEKAGDGDGENSDDEKIQKMTDEVRKATEEARVTGHPLTPEMRRKQNWLIDEGLTRKFGSSKLQK